MRLFLAPMLVALFLVPLFLVAGSALSPAPLPAPQAQTSPQAQTGGLPAVGDPQRLVFHAVLEGLYRDGVSNEVVDAVTEVDGETGWPRFFIYACPICMPCFDAFRTYRARPEFFGSKQRRDTFGAGLPDDVKRQLLSEDPVLRVAAIRDRIEIWIGRRLETMRLRADEREEALRRFREMGKKGSALLEGYQKRERTAIYGHMEYCPFCEGVARAAGH